MGFVYWYWVLDPTVLDKSCPLICTSTEGFLDGLAIHAWHGILEHLGIQGLERGVSS